MKIVLTRPNYYTHLITPPLGIGYLSSYLRQQGIETRIVDGLNLGLSADELVRQCADADVVGISCLSDYYLETVQLAQALKAAGKTVVIGGPHATALPVETLAETHADFAVIGEGEVSLCELVRCLEKKGATDGLEGVLARDGSTFVRRNLIEDLDLLPFPDWRQMDPRTYRKAPHGGLIKRFPVAPITSTRGCPYACKFCASPTLWNRQIRFRSPQNVVDEIEMLVRDFGVREIHFEDDNLTLKASHAEAICKLLIERRLDICWAAPNGIRVDAVTPELLGLMKQSGCYYLAFGIESGNQAILDGVGKKTSLSAIEAAVRLAHDAGILTQGFFIFGLPGETEATVEETVQFAKRIPLDRAQFLLLDVLPGSELWDELRGQFEPNWALRSYQEVKWTPPTISREVLAAAPSRAFRRFFLRPRPLLGLLRYVRLSQLRFILQRVADFRVFRWRRSP